MNKMAHEVRGDDGIWRWQWYEGPTLGEKAAVVARKAAAVALSLAALFGVGKVAQIGYEKWNEPAISTEQMSEMTNATISHIEDQMNYFERNGSKDPNGEDYDKYEATNRIDNPDGTYQMNDSNLSAFMSTSEQGKSVIGFQVRYNHLEYDDKGRVVAGHENNRGVEVNYNFSLQDPVRRGDVDTNKDGAISPAEALKAVREYGGNISLVEMEVDRNGDGKFSGERGGDDHSEMTVDQNNGVSGIAGGSIVNSPISGGDSGDAAVSHFFVALDVVEARIGESRQ